MEQIHVRGGYNTPQTHKEHGQLKGLRLSLNIDLTLNHQPKELYGLQRRVLLRKGARESSRHVMMKLMAMLMFYHDDLVIEGSAHQHYKPDLVRLNAQQEPVQWIDCGHTSIKKLNRITQRNHETTVDIVKATPGELAMYRREAQRQLRYPERVDYWSFERQFIRALGARVHGRHALVATVTPEMESVYLSIDGYEMHTPLIHLMGG